MRSHRLYCLAALGCSLFVISGMAGTVSVGFEGPSYAVGDINGQQGWSKTGSYDAQVSSSASYQGSQSLRISNGITSGSFGDQTFTPQLAVPAGESTVPGAVDTFLSSWYFKSVTGSLQDGLGISVSADNGQGARMTWVRLGRSARVDQWERVEATHSENGTGNRSEIRALSSTPKACIGELKRASGIIHAAGVRFAFPSSAPGALGVDAKNPAATRPARSAGVCGGDIESNPG